MSEEEIEALRSKVDRVHDLLEWLCDEWKASRTPIVPHPDDRRYWPNGTEDHNR